MRYIMIHDTNPKWEAGAVPDKELIENVGKLIGELAQQKKLLAGDGLRASSEGVRLDFVDGKRVITKGPYTGGAGAPAGFSIVQTATIDEAVEWATQQAAVMGDEQVDVRPVTEAWDIGIAPKPAKLPKRRWMALRKVTPATEARDGMTAEQRSGMKRLIEKSAGVHMVTENLRPTRRGRRYMNTNNGLRVTDGPFAESKELIAGFVMILADSMDELHDLATRYVGIVETPGLQIRELDDPL